MKGTLGRDQKHLSVRICFVLEDVKKSVIVASVKGAWKKGDMVIKMLTWLDQIIKDCSLAKKLNFLI